MNVLHVLNSSVPRLQGYTTRSYHLVNNQKKLGVYPVVLTSERFGNAESDKEEIDGIPYYRTRVRHTLTRRIPILAELDEIRCLRGRVEMVALDEKIDLLHAHSPSLMGAACLRLHRKMGIPLVYEIRAFWEDAAVDQGAFGEGSFKYRLRRLHEGVVIKNASLIIAISEGIKKDLLSRGIPKKKIRIVKNGVDYNLFRPQAVNIDLKRKYNCEHKIVIGFIGSFFNFEGLSDLILAMRELSRTRNDVVLMLVGKGEVEARLKQMTARYGLTDRIIFTGQIPHDKVRDYYSIMDMLVYPRKSRRITELVTPLKPLEAMSMGKPIVISDVGGLRELIDQKDTAITFRSGDVVELAEKLMELCAKEGLRKDLGRRARAAIVKSWGWEKRAESVAKIYEEILT